MGQEALEWKVIIIKPFVPDQFLGNVIFKKFKNCEKGKWSWFPAIKKG